MLLDRLGGYRIDVELTDADGDHVVAVSADPFVVQRTTKVDVRVLQLVRVPLFTATRVDATTVAFTGRVDFDGNTPMSFPVDVEYAADGQQWQRVATVTASARNNGRVEFLGTAPSTGSGLWRARFQETASFQGAVSAAARVD